MEAAASVTASAAIAKIRIASPPDEIFLMRFATEGVLRQPIRFAIHINQLVVLS
jgi:hypothetical protein